MLGNNAWKGFNPQKRSPAIPAVACFGSGLRPTLAPPLKLSVKSDYATRAVLTLAQRFRSPGPVRIEDIALENGIPANYLVQILIELKAGQIVQSQRGKAGGYRLARPPGRITFADVLRCVHGPLFEPPASGDDRCPEPLRAVWDRLGAAVEAEAERVNFQQLADVVPNTAGMFDI